MSETKLFEYRLAARAQKVKIFAKEVARGKLRKGNFFIIIFFSSPSLFLSTYSRVHVTTTLLFHSLFLTQSFRVPLS